MSDMTTDRLGLPLLQPGQAQKEMSHNEALARLDIAVQAQVIAAGDNIPPDTPEPGQAWIVGPEPGGAWTGRPGALAGWTASGWRFVAPREGLCAYVSENGGFALFADGEWHFDECRGRLIIDGVQVVGPRLSAIADPEGGTNIDAEARVTIAAILAAMREHGLLVPS